jgi:hypothetical protein
MQLILRSGQMETKSPRASSLRNEETALLISMHNVELVDLVHTGDRLVSAGKCIET